MEANLLKLTLPVSPANAARMALPSVWDISNVGRYSNASPRNVPEISGALDPPAKL